MNTFFDFSKIEGIRIIFSNSEYWNFLSSNEFHIDMENKSYSIILQLRNISTAYWLKVKLETYLIDIDFVRKIVKE